MSKFFDLARILLHIPTKSTLCAPSHKLFARKYHVGSLVDEEVPIGTIRVGDNKYMDFGGVIHNRIGDKLVEVPQWSNAVGVIITLPLGEVNEEGTFGYHEGRSSE